MLLRVLLMPLLLLFTGFVRVRRQPIGVLRRAAPDTRVQARALCRSGTCDDAIGTSIAAAQLAEMPHPLRYHTRHVTPHTM